MLNFTPALNCHLFVGISPIASMTINETKLNVLLAAVREALVES